MEPFHNSMPSPQFVLFTTTNQLGSVKANRREYKSSWVQVFNLKLVCLLLWVMKIRAVENSALLKLFHKPMHHQSVYLMQIWDFKKRECTQIMIFSSVWDNKTRMNQAHIRHLCMKTTVLSYHRCLINTCVEKMNNI